MRNDLFAMYYEQNKSNIPLIASLGYVTDGLIAMWDGEYNLGNRHSSTTTTWVDMVGGDRLDYVGDDTYEWKDKCCSFNGETGYGCFVKVLPEADRIQGPVTVENSSGWTSVGGGASTIPSTVVYYVARGTYHQSRGHVTVVTTGFYGGLIASLNSRKVYTLAGYSPAYNSQWTDMLATYDGGAWKVLDSGGGSGSVPQSMLRIGGSYVAGSAPFGGAGRVYSARIYNRQLTQAELAQNYNVDKARFGTSYQ